MTKPLETQQFDIAVIGAGPAGAHAALAAANHGLKCVLLDEASAAGGQAWRQPRTASIEPNAKGYELNQALARSTVTTLYNRRVWLVEHGFVVHAVSSDGPEHFTADQLIVAAGTSERVLPFKGWTTPGVIGLAAATILLKADATTPGHRTLVAGQGPLLALVAADILAKGGEVVGVVDAASRTDWLRNLPALRHRPDDLRRGIDWYFSLFRHGVAVRHSCSIVSVEAIDSGLRVLLSNGERYESDAVAVGNGLTPAVEIARLLSAPMHFVDEMGGWLPIIDESGRSGIDGLWFCGDGAGVRGVAVAVEAGTLCGTAAANNAGMVPADEMAKISSGLRTTIGKFAQAGAAMAKHLISSPQAINSISTDTIICRCEDITLGEIDDAIQSGATEMNQIKSWTRCGMGPCQGRMCGETVGMVLAERTRQSRAELSPWTVRAPLRPLPLEAMVGEFDYDDIPIPAAAPL